MFVHKLDAHVCACIRTQPPWSMYPLTTPSPAATDAPPPPPHAIAIFYACRTQCGASCATAGGRLRTVPITAGADQPPESTVWNTTAAPSRACLCQQSTTVDKIGQITCKGRGGGRQRGPNTCLRCTVWQAITTARLRENCSVQPSLPCDTLPCAHIHSAGADTLQYSHQSVPIGFDKVPPTRPLVQNARWGRSQQTEAHHTLFLPLAPARTRAGPFAVKYRVWERGTGPQAADVFHCAPDGSIRRVSLCA